MEQSHEILDTIETNSNKSVIELLKKAISQENIIVESETTEDSETTEIEEIIEIIEEVEEESEESLEADDPLKGISDKDDERSTERLQNDLYDRSSEMELYGLEENNSVVKPHSENENERRYRSHMSSGKQVITYDVDEDWQDEDMDEEEKSEQDSDTMDHCIEYLRGQRTQHRDRKSINNQTIIFPLQTNRSESRDNVELPDRTEKSRLGQDLKNNVNNDENVDTSISHEIVKNVENNLLYTVLGTKKQNTVKTLQVDKLSDAHFIKMEQLDENTIPIEGTIYYEGDNIEALYVAQSVDDNERYPYNPVPMEQDEQAPETVHSDANQNPEKENSQDQIFLHEDEEGQLYFKDDTGTLQPVYLTEDGHYAIAENGVDPISRESQAKSQQNARQIKEESYVLPDIDPKFPPSNTQNSAVSANDLESEDNTVTISLIISEDEHGQKRTQVIIPTTDNLKCDICNKSFKTSFQLLRHNRLKHAREEDVTTRNFPCDLCPKRYPDQNSLARHRKTHTGDRPFQCLECHKNFPTSTALRRHLTLHNSQSRPLPCIYCGRRFVEKASLVKHEQSHLADDQRSHTCDVCHKSFLHATDLSLHKKNHDPDKKFDCEVCGREFNRLNNLQRHMMVHQQQGANEEILSCDVCGITYKFMSSLTRHMVTTHMNPEKLRQQAAEQRRKRENNYRRYLENRKMYDTQHSGGFVAKRNYQHNTRSLSGSNEEAA
ncbi:zinc finger protein 652-A-like isoform X1 [Hylaeus anthracinus]|uniref:zinc finger protein 652-A-like isoform X1 n=1 Tax=Hylaeus anthracinus TaxID=313031 RepID=UPI0023B8ABE5|nr:zinc finger protein 652-A-like isoform X1 [Hylaeus anthracinus]XP_054007351.1 zinc finger protein 652-A-like isoform X1 [Hylaeus anthracinus]